jgi:hypothetical protein
VGLRMRVRSLSTVLFPAPFGPMMPSASPGSTVNDTSWSAQNLPLASSLVVAARRVSRRPSAGRRSRRLSWTSP